MLDTPAATQRARVRVPLRFHDGYSVDAELVTFHGLADGQEHVAVVLGRPGPVPLVRLHSECLTGDVFHSLRCDCGQQLEDALARIEQEGAVVLLYLSQEGRGIGLLNKIRAYALQDQGHDTVQANHALGFATDLRDFKVGAHILFDLGVNKVRLITNNPDKVRALESYGLTVSERVAIEIPPRLANRGYLATKRDKLGHLLSLAGVDDTKQ